MGIIYSRIRSSAIDINLFGLGKAMAIGSSIGFLVDESTPYQDTFSLH